VAEVLAFVVGSPNEAGVGIITGKSHQSLHSAQRQRTS